MVTSLGPYGIHANLSPVEFNHFRTILGYRTNMSAQDHGRIEYRNQQVTNHSRRLSETMSAQSATCLGISGLPATRLSSVSIGIPPLVDTSTSSAPVLPAKMDIISPTSDWSSQSSYSDTLLETPSASSRPTHISTIPLNGSNFYNDCRSSRNTAYYRQQQHIQRQQEHLQLRQQDSGAPGQYQSQLDQSILPQYSSACPVNADTTQTGGESEIPYHFERETLFEGSFRELFPHLPF